MADAGWRDAIAADWPVLPDDVGFEAAQEVLANAGLGDGLPLVPPTSRRIATMLAGAGDPAASRGMMPPLFGELTTAAIGYCAVLAGCRPDELPVVVAASGAALEPEFNLLGMATTTGSAAIGVIVHGALAERLGMNAGINCMGPGNRANAAIGRAMSLVLRNIGGAQAGSGDMATVGQPAKYGLCFAEGAGIGRGWPQLAERRGFAAGEDAVTVIGISGTAEVLPVEGRDSPDAILDPAAASMRTAFQVNGGAKQPEPSEQLLVLPPELATQIAGHGWDLARVCDHLFAATRIDGRPIAPSADAILPIITGGPGVKMAHLPLWGGGTRVLTRRVAVLGFS